jgi:hypothetical protein
LDESNCGYGIGNLNGVAALGVACVGGKFVVFSMRQKERPTCVALRDRGGRRGGRHGNSLGGRGRGMVTARMVKKERR